MSVLVRCKSDIVSSSVNGSRSKVKADFLEKQFNVLAGGSLQVALNEEACWVDVHDCSEVLDLLERRVFQSPLKLTHVAQTRY